MTTKFNIKDTVVAFDWGRPYEAVVVKTKENEEQSMVFIHFKGWSRKYDAWYESKNIALKSDEERIKVLHAEFAGKQQEAMAAKQQARREAREAKKAAEAEEQAAEESKKRKRERTREEELAWKERMNELKRNRAVLAQSDLADEDEEDRELLSKLELPYNIKRHLVDEWNLVTTEPKRLVHLPRTHTVENIFAEYIANKKKELGKKTEEDFEEDGKNLEEQLQEFQDVVDGLIVWFDRALPMTLLYRQERGQYNKIMQKLSKAVGEGELETESPAPSKVYGVEHLARMFVRMASLMRGIYVKADDINIFYEKVADFLRFLNKEHKKYTTLEDYLAHDEVMADD
jgi:hypothetical protein